MDWKLSWRHSQGPTVKQLRPIASTPVRMLQLGADNVTSLKEEQSHEGTKGFRTRQAVVDCCHWKVGPLPTGIEE